MNVRTTRSATAQAASPVPARVPLRRRSRLSAADRFWMTLGSVVGIVLAPVAGIALLPEGGDGPQGRASATPDDGPRGKGAAAALLDAADAGADGPPPSAKSAAPSADPAQGTPRGLDPMALADAASPAGGHDIAGLRAILHGGGGGGGGPVNRTARDTIDDFDPALVPRHGRVPFVMPAHHGPALDLPHRLPDGWPSLAKVTHLGTDRDTWGAVASFLIVSRAQDHMVETADGALHMLINRGIDNGLTLITSRDGGKTWSITDGDSFGMENRTATSDIRLLDGQDMMIVTYVDDAGRVAFALYGYDLFTGSWSRLESSIVDPGLVSPGTVQATIAMSDAGTILLAYTEEVDTGLRLVLQQSTDGGHSWTATVLAQPSIEAGTARVIAAGEHEGIIYSNAEAMYWLTWDSDDGWTMDMIDASGTIGRFASHFSTVTHGDDVVAVNVGTDLALHVLLFDGATGTWSDPISPLGADVDVSSAQISISDDTGRIYITFDDVNNPGRLIVIESRDGGETWRLEAVLQTPPSVVAPPTRFEAPEHFSGDLVVTQQILYPDNTNVNGLYFHVVDVDGPGTPIPPDILLGHTDSFLF